MQDKEIEGRLQEIEDTLEELVAGQKETTDVVQGYLESLAGTIREAEEKMVEMTGLKPVSTVDISPVIGMHAGNGAIAISILFNN